MVSDLNHAPVGAANPMALAPLRIWIVGKLELLQPLLPYGAQIQALDSVEALYRELVIVPCDIVVIDTTQVRTGLVETVEHLRRRDDLGVVLLVDPLTPQLIADGLWAGADACLPHRPEPEFLAAKLYSLRRRLPGEAAQLMENLAASDSTSWALESDGWDLRGPSGQILALTEAERAFLTLLFSSPAETVARERLIAALTDQPWSFDPHRIEVLVHRLRNRVQAATSCTLPVRAVRGAGYRLTI